MVFIVMGVSGCGKTTVGKLLAGRIAFPFHDADDFHSQGNLEKMNNGVPLTDEDRVPWLFDLAVHVAQWNRHGGAVLACSALKKQYRDMLDWNGKEEVAYIHLKGDRDFILGRLRDRTGHFFPPSLLESQFRDLEEPVDAVTVSIDSRPDDICTEIITEIIRRELLPQSYIRSLNIG
ncbi:MAG TPA: gluconokinase [Spirochaetota bacterium]|nr:gluconokinase [Spirochaetota bacterium]HPC39655.1 gluconokinase [Spirochaetota bacterium]HPL17619.1 gluconokinase [Spirochaetota bacterium]HQF07382.1 gluconokinase [Spirochaetota bacterium]HQH96642.1 gluconokinase [Spirochaetota bacterium]